MHPRMYFSLVALMIIAFVGNASAITITGNANGITATGNYQLDGSTALASTILLNPSLDTVYRDTSIKGEGYNELKESVSTKKNTVENTAASSGSMSLSSTSVGGKFGVSTSHAANLEGDSGQISIISSSPNNKYIVDGIFDGEGSLSENIEAFSGENAYVGGTIESAGVNILDEDLSQQLASTEGIMSLEGLYVTRDDAIGKINFQVSNLKGKPAPQPPSPPVTIDSAWLASDGAHPEITSNGGYADSYAPTVWKIGDPVQLYLRSDSNLAGEGLTANQAGQAIITAAETWDFYTTKDLFQNNIIISSSVSADRGDGKSVHAFKPISGGAIAYARTYRDSSNIVRESDVCYNTRLGWTTTWGSTYPEVDLQSIALHELGHTAGLGDLYLLDKSSRAYNDWQQIMNSYDGPQHNLGDGDISYLQQKYGL